MEGTQCRPINLPLDPTSGSEFTIGTNNSLTTIRAVQIRKCCKMALTPYLKRGISILRLILKHSLKGYYILYFVLRTQYIL